MGAYLSAPVTDKERFEGVGKALRYGGGSMQGWRRTMEDAHIAEVGLSGDATCAMFGVFDGHGGAEVAKFCQKYMADEIQKLQEFDGGVLEDALIAVFHRMDDMLRDHVYADELKQLKTPEMDDDEDLKDEGDAPGGMDAFSEVIKRMFTQSGLKRFLPENGAADGHGASSSDPNDEEDMETEQQQPASEPQVEPADSRVQAGCTAVVAVKKGNELFVANAGDSRGVLCRGGQALALSVDHKPAQEGERTRIINAGGFLSEIGGVCRVNGNLNLSRAIGDLKYKCNTALPPKDQIITAQPDVRRFTLQADDSFFVLACDGVWDVLSNQECVEFIGEQLAAGTNPADAACALLDRCLASDPKAARGVGCDNMTAIVVQLHAAAGGRGSGEAAVGSATVPTGAAAALPSEAAAAAAAAPAAEPAAAAPPSHQ